ncbi:unnamed protein product [Auanema sp. JU1783]|nr:unnamed protein product [Auanema sp. JU1783]
MAPRDVPSTTNGDVTESKPMKNKPKASKLRQQKLPAWQPILTAPTVIPTVVFIGIVFIPIGIALFLASESVHEYKIDYTDCSQETCTFTLDVKEDMKGDVYIYYALENFYQNHRRYVKSRNDKQYLGNLDQVSDCEPYDKGMLNGVQVPIAPCGAIANSIFNDTFGIKKSALIDVPTTTEGVLWDIDFTKKFKNPPVGPGETLCSAFKGTVRPPNWSKDICELGGFLNVDFIVWMRTAALPNFRKLWRLVDRTKSGFTDGLSKGQYQVQINNNYPVTAFGGRKQFIISTTSWAGGKNSFLGIAYLVVGSIAIALAVIFFIIHMKFGHSVNELSNVGPVQ